MRGRFECRCCGSGFERGFDLCALGAGLAGLTTTALTTNTVVLYKYAINGYGGTWEGNVGAGGAQNRSFTVTSTNQVLPPDYWNNVTNANLSFAITFQVDMTTEDAFGVFTPGGNSVFVNGDWDWSGRSPTGSRPRRSCRPWGRGL